MNWKLIKEDKMKASKTKFRHQKNIVMHGIIVNFANIDQLPDHCSNQAKLRIMHQHNNMGMDPSTPLAVYKKNKNSRKGSFFTKRGVKRVLNAAGKAIYGNGENQNRFAIKWTCHSACIGATALLFGKYRDPLLIKSQLRWVSDKFKVYIRFTPILARIHADAMTTDINRYVTT